MEYLNSEIHKPISNNGQTTRNTAEDFMNFIVSKENSLGNQAAS